MDHVYDTPDEAQQDGLATTRDINHNEAEDGDYVNASEATHAKVLNVLANDDEYQYAEITRTVTVTKEQEGDSITETKVTVTTVHTSSDVGNSTGEVLRQDDDVISQRSDVKDRDVRELYDEVTNNDVTREGNDVDSPPKYETVGNVSNIDDQEEGISVKVEITVHSDNTDASLMVEKLVEGEFERENLVERLVERELEDEHDGITERLEERREERENEKIAATYEEVEGNVYEYIEESRETIRDRDLEYGNMEEQQQQQQQQHQNDEEEGLYDETYATLEERIETKQLRHEADLASEHVNESDESKPVISTFAASVSVDSTDNGSSKKQQPPSSGKFVMRAISRADPGHVIQCITQNSEEASQHNPEQDELIHYIKGDADAGEFRRLKSWITSPLIQQFNKEAQSGAEVGQSFFPKNVGVSSARTSVGSTTVTREVRAVTSPTSPPVTAARGVDEPSLNHEVAQSVTVIQKTVVVSPSSEKPAIEVVEDPLKRNGEIAKAVEAADFRPVAHKPQVAQTNGVDEGKNKAVVGQTTSTQGLSVYSKQSTVKIESTHEAGNLQKQTSVQTADWKAELDRRKQNKEFVVAQKPNQPLKLAEVPDWKKALMEKNKQRKSSSDDPTKVHEGGKEDHLEWKKEIKQILKQKSMAEGVLDQESEVPEWQKIADSKK